MNGNKSRTLELLWRVFTTCYLPKHLSPIEKLQEEIATLTENLGQFNCRQVEQQLISSDLIPLQKQQVDFSTEVHLLIKWAQLLCAHYKFWLYDLQESFIDGRAFLYIISYYLPSLCDYSRDIKHLTTLATCQTREEHIQFNLELGEQQQPQSVTTYERNVKSNFRFLEECIKQFGSFSNDLVKYESYAKDVPDERCTIMILAMLAHDLLFANNLNNESDFRHQSIFEELKEKYSIDDEPLIEEKKDVIASVDVPHQDDNTSISIEAVSLLEDFIPPLIGNGPEVKSLKPSISSTTINIPLEESTTKIHPLPIIPAEVILIDTEEDEAEQDTTNVTILSPPSSPEKPDWSFVEPPACVYDQTLSDSLYA
jgi:hypothetical protein